MAHVIARQGKKITTRKKNTKIKIKCVGGGGGTNLLFLLCLISNTMPQLEQSSLQRSTDLQHRHLQTTSYNHLLLLHLLISREGKPKQQQARTPPPPPPPPLDGGGGGVRSQKGLRPFNPLQRIELINIPLMIIQIRCLLRRKELILELSLISSNGSFINETKKD